MGKINVLESCIYNKIAAGEVAERPSSVVKELVENAIDAGATNISVAIKEGGLLGIIVTDNGCGMDCDDAKKAFLPHATSKIKTEEDLFSIATLGFRGEALASIAAVSKVELITRTADSDTGVRVLAEDGKINIFECGSNTGTRIAVNNLFYNTPARFKFLKKPRYEASEITNLVSRFILANPEICFAYEIDGETIFENTGKGLEHAIFTVYGKSALENLIAVHNQYKDITVTGYIGRTNYTKPNSTYQTQIINGRWISSGTVSSAAMNAYRDYLLPRNYPFYVLSLSVPADKIDVNVHPNKSDVRFTDSGEVYAAVYNTLRRTLENTRTTESEEFVSMIEDREIRAETVRKQETIWQRPVVNMGYAGTLNENDSALKAFYSTPEILSQAEHFDIITPENIENSSETVKIIGQLFKTYIIIEYYDRFSIIDQHAAHERLLYDKFEKQLAENNVYTQILLVPYTLSLNPIEYSYMSERLDVFRQLGFDIQSFGNLSFIVYSVPYVVSLMNFDSFFSEILKSAKQGGEIKMQDAFRHCLMQKACKAAVKEGDTLSVEEIKAILNAITAEKPELYCPHGRPVIREFKKSEVEKWFKRT